jgi:hypothetical protein
MLNALEMCSDLLIWVTKHCEVFIKLCAIVYHIHIPYVGLYIVKF